MTRAERLVPELTRFVRYAAVADGEIDRQFAALLAVLQAVTGPEAFSAQHWESNCGCQLHRALDDLRALTRTGKRRR